MSAPEDSSTAIRSPDETMAQPESRGDPTVRFTYRADDTRLGQPVALKFLPAAFIVQIVGQALYGALVDWGVYVAVEPAVRRRWPETLISWSRLLNGRFRDPLVGRDVLAGLIAGIVAALLDD